MVTSTQINIRLADPLLAKAKTYAEKQGFSNLQELIKELLREKIFNKSRISKNELELIQKIIIATNEKKQWKSKKDLLKALDK